MGDRSLSQPITTAPALSRLRRYLVIYFVVLGFIQIGLVANYYLAGQAAFLSETKSLYTWGIIFTVLYKQIIITVMLTTPNKSLLDIAFIWHTQAVSLLFIYSWLFIVTPATFIENPVVSAVAFFELWVQVFFSALAVLYALWIERLKWAALHVRSLGWRGFRERCGVVFLEMRAIGWRGAFECPRLIREIIFDDHASVRSDYRDGEG